MRRLRAVTALLVLTACGGHDAPTAAPAEYPTDPALAQLVTDDVDRYWRAYDAGGKSGNSTAFQRRYLDSATAGLREFIGLRQLTATSLVQVATAYPAYLDALHTWWTTANRTAVLSTIRANYATIKQLYPNAFFPPVTLLVGRYSTAGTAGTSGLLVGFEFFGTDANAPLGALNSFARDNQKSWATDLAPLVAHEHTHYLSLRAGATSARNGAPLYARVLHEGVAEFIASLVAGQPSYRTFFRTWQANEATYFAEFLQEKDGSDVSRWLYNQGSTTGGRPGDLGYFIGFRIAQAYYNRAANKAQAVRELIELRDPAGILTQSGYAGAGPPIP
ncbi:MAG: DUF2268 domain-containing protein [Gemmatimonadaceae bacterium]|nr:DUF2268 domain-containing protein [Gemmatimonadaceae bacterium]